MNEMQSRFEAKYIPEPNSGCWLWTASIKPSGYGQFARSHGDIDYAHRVSWQLYLGKIPDGLHVLHKCDVRNCVNPEHLFVGTNADNHADKIAKGRQRSVSPKISDEQVREIKNSTDARILIAKRYGISKSHVANIQNGYKRTKVIGV